MNLLGMKLMKFATVSLVALALTAGTAYAQLQGQVSYSSDRGPAPPMGAANCAAGEVHDDGIPETGLGWINTITDGINANAFSPVSDFNYTEVCICWSSTVDTTVDFFIDVWDDSGPSGSPGVRLGTLAAQATGVPTFPGQWYSYDISSLNVTVAAGDTVYIGPRLDASVDAGFFLCADWSNTTPTNSSRDSNDGGVNWVTTISNWVEHRAYLVRADGQVVDPVASFTVTKDFDDDNTAGVDIEIECTTGVPMSSDATVYEFHDIFDEIEFKVQDFDRGELDCTITEDVPEGYDPTYCPGDGQSCNDTGCTYEEVDWAESFHCEITNNLRQAEVYVDKVWIDEQAVENSSHLFAGARWECEPVADFDNRGNGSHDHGFLWFVDPSTVSPGVFSDDDSFWFYPHFEGSNCSVSEAELDSDILSDDSDCDEFEIFPGYKADLDGDDNPIPICTIINTRVYAGIPTLSDYGLALLALLMLGIGFVGYRRIA